VRVVEGGTVSGSGNGNGGGPQRATNSPTVATVPEGTGKRMAESSVGLVTVEAMERHNAALAADSEPEVWKGWKNHSDALVWASEQGVYNAPEHAQNSYKLLAEELFPGVKHTSAEQKVQLFEAFYAKVQGKLENKAEKEAASEDIDFGMDKAAGTVDENPFVDSK
jgi:hypothetical protein